MVALGLSALIVFVVRTSALPVDSNAHHLGAVGNRAVQKQSVAVGGDCEPLDFPGFPTTHACFDTHNTTQGSVFCWQRCLDDVARATVDDALRVYDLQLVTAESLTAGMILGRVS